MELNQFDRSNGHVETLGSGATFVWKYGHRRLIVEFAGASAATLDLGTYIGRARPGDTLLIHTTSSASITVTGLQTRDVNGNALGTSNTVTGPGAISFYINNQKELQITSSVKR